MHATSDNGEVRSLAGRLDRAEGRPVQLPDRVRARLRHGARQGAAGRCWRASRRSSTAATATRSELTARQLRIRRGRPRRRRRPCRPDQAAPPGSRCSSKAAPCSTTRGDLLRVEGKLSKNPSFWTSLVNIVRRYARIGGVRVPVATETTAKVKFVGTAQLEVALRLPERQRPAGRAQRTAVSNARAYR